jgi:hypothetical protein
MSLDAHAKGKINSRICELVTRKHFDLGMSGANWEELSRTRKNQILRSNSHEEFEKQIQELPGNWRQATPAFGTPRAILLRAANFHLPARNRARVQRLHKERTNRRMSSE